MRKPYTTRVNPYSDQETSQRFSKNEIAFLDEMQKKSDDYYKNLGIEEELIQVDYNGCKYWKYVYYKNGEACSSLDEALGI